MSERFVEFVLELAECSVFVAWATFWAFVMCYYG